MYSYVSNKGQWVPKESCGYPANYSLARYALAAKYEFIEADFNIYYYGTAVFVKFRVTQYSTTKPVVIMTICLVVTEASFRITNTLTLFQDNISAALMITTNFYRIFQMFYPLNSIAHCFINMMLSSEYKRCIKESFECFHFCAPKQETSQSRNSGSTRNATTRMT
ncbi:unnamed protein product [Caenorhabditis brenneri]